MSILDHSSQYDKTMESDDPNFGKYFYFCGSMRRPKKSREARENEIIAVDTHVDESAPPLPDFDESAPSPDCVDSEDEEDKHGGTYFKLNGSVGDQSDLSEDDEHDGGRWFGVSVRKRRAESMQNLLEIVEPERTVQQFLPHISEKKNDHSDEVDMRDSTPHDKDSTVDMRDSALHERDSTPHDRDSTPHERDSTVDTRDSTRHERDSTFDESIPNDNVIDQQLLEDFDAQFLEIEKLVMESFDDIDFSVTSPTLKTNGKKNKRFGVDEMESEPSVTRKSIPTDNEIPVARTFKTNDKKKSFPSENEPSRRSKANEPPVTRKSIPTDNEIPVRRKSKPSDKGTTSIDNDKVTNRSKPDDNKILPVTNRSKFSDNNKQSKHNHNDIFQPKQMISIDDDPPPHRPSPPVNYKQNIHKSSPRQNVKRVDKDAGRPPPENLSSFLNGYAEPSKTTEHSITVSSPDTGEKEYRIGETIHFQVSVKEKKHPSVSEDVFEEEEKPISKPVTKPANKPANKPTKRKVVGKPDTPKSVAEKKYQYENHIQDNSPKKQHRQTPTKMKTKVKVKQVEEDIVQEQHVKDDYAMNELDLDQSFIDTYLTENATSTPSKVDNDTTDHVFIKAPKRDVILSTTKTTAEPPRQLKRSTNMSNQSLRDEDSRSTGTADDNRSEFDTSEDEASSGQPLKRNRSFRRSIIIEDDEVSVRRRKSIGGTSVSVAFIAVNKQSGEEEKITIPQRLKAILNLLDNMVLDDESLGLYYDSVRQLHTVFWDLKDGSKSSGSAGGTENEMLSSVLNFLVVQEWPKVMLGCFKKLKAAYPHVFKQEQSLEATVYYSGHLPSLLRMNRTTPEFAVSVIFDGLLRAAINFTDIHEASRQACCEDNLLSYLMDEIMTEMHNIKWGKATAREMFLKSMSDLIYNCAQSYSNAGYLLENNCVDTFTQLRNETFHIVDARKVNMTLLLTLSYLIDDNNYDIIVPDEGSIIRLLQFLDKSLEHSEHTHHEFYAAELAECLSRLTGHSANKILVTRNSGQEILHKLLKYAYDDSERIAACHALWNLSFCREAKDILRGMTKLMNLLRELAASSNLNLHRAAAGIIWECEDKYDIKGTRAIHQSEPGHVMISYENEVQPLVIGIRDELNRKGYQVWMSNDVEERSLEDIMTKGVERASIIIVAVTRKYKLTPYAFAEVDYAHTLRKKVIPIIIDVDFVPDGWLKELVNNEKSFDFSRRSMFAGSLDALTDHVTSQCSPRPTETLNAESDDGSRSSDVLSWSNADVIYWLKDNQLIRSVNNAGRLNKLTGLHLIMFFDLKRESPDYYYSVLDSHLGFKDVLDTLEFTYAMDRLLGSERLI